LTRKLLEHLGGTGESVTRFTDRNVQDELLNAQLTHRVAGLVVGSTTGGGVSLLIGALSLGLPNQSISERSGRRNSDMKSARMRIAVESR